MLDTGFQGQIALPDALLRELGVAAVREPILVRHADGGIRRADAYSVLLQWEGRWREVEVLAQGNDPLLGTEAFEDCHVDIEATEGGEVIIEPL